MKASATSEGGEKVELKTGELTEGSGLMGPLLHSEQLGDHPSPTLWSDGSSFSGEDRTEMDGETPC